MHKVYAMRRAALVLIAAAGISGQANAQKRVEARLAPTDAPLANPERGFYRASRGDLDRIDPGFLEAAYRDGYRLIYARINLEPYRTGPLPADYLARLETGFAAARRAGVKLIVRAVYNYPRGETEYRDAKDAALPMVLRHLAQLKPVLQANADAIGFVQAGFVGAWGEWHTSSNGLTEPAARGAIKDALLDAAPADRFVQFRYPPYIRDWAAELPTPATAIARGFRIGFHNDCFLASQTDVGTFSEDAGTRTSEQAYLDRLGDVAPFGGETCNPADDPGAAPRTACADILREGARYNLTYLNADYYRRLFHDAWERGGCSEAVAAKMGYRLALVAVAHPAQALAGSGFRLDLTVRNDGWARLFNPRVPVLILRNRAGGAPVRLTSDADMRGWLPGESQVLPLAVTLPRTMPRGTYDLLVAFPDPSARLTNDPRYAVRPANAEVSAKGQGWDAALGAFRTGTRVDVR